MWVKPKKKDFIDRLKNDKYFFIKHIRYETIFFGYCFIEVIILRKYLFFCITICFLSFVLLDYNIISGISSSYFKFSAMIFLFFTANHFKKMILSYTIFCDFLLLFTSFYSIGVAFFTIVHLLYLCQMIPFLEYEKRQQECMFILLPFGILLSFLPLYWIVACYSMIFLLHILIVFTQKYSKVYELGLLLFALCDCCTAISFLTGNIMVAKCIWILYLPSQILLSITEQYSFSIALLPLPIKYHSIQKKR